jgi:hypothetical protein
MNCIRRGGNVFRIVFKTRHALLLPGGRILRPPCGRNQGAEQARRISDSWPQTRLGHERDLIQVRTQSRVVRVREQSAHADIPRQRAGLQLVQNHDSKTVSVGSGQALALDARCPNTVRVRGLSTNMSMVCPGAFPALQRAMDCPRSRIVADFVPAVSFLLHIQMIPSYGHV